MVGLLLPICQTHTPDTKTLTCGAIFDAAGAQGFCGVLDRPRPSTGACRQLPRRFVCRLEVGALAFSELEQRWCYVFYLKVTMRAQRSHEEAKVQRTRRFLSPLRHLEVIPRGVVSDRGGSGSVRFVCQLISLNTQSAKRFDSFAMCETF